MPLAPIEAMTRAEYAGFEAFQYRDPITSNPYKEGNKAWLSWRKGWNYARERRWTLLTDLLADAQEAGFNVVVR